MKSLPALALALAFLLSVPATAHAQGIDAHTEAENQFKKGRKAMDQGDYAEALVLFRASQALEAGRGKLLNMGICEERLGMVATALGHFQEVAKQLPANDDRRPIVLEYLQKLPLRIPHLRVDLSPAAPPSAEVTLDGAPLERARLGTDLALDAGKHVVVVKAPGASEKLYETTLEEGKRVTLSVEAGSPLSAGPEPRPSAGPEPDVAPRKSLAPAIGLGVVGVAGVAVGAALAGAYFGKRSESEKLSQEIGAGGGSCAAGAAAFDATRCSALKDATLSGDTFSLVSIVAFVAGGVSAAGAVGYLLFWPDPKKDPSQQIGIQFAPFVTSHQQGITAWGSF